MQLRRCGSISALAQLLQTHLCVAGLVPAP